MGTAGAPAKLAQNRHDSPPHVVPGIDSGTQAGRAPPEKVRLNPVYLFQTNFFSLHLHLSCPQMCQPFWRQECKRPHISTEPFTRAARGARVSRSGPWFRSPERNCEICRHLDLINITRARILSVRSSRSLDRSNASDLSIRF